MSKQKHLKIPIPKWTWWQTTKAIALIILVSRIKINEEIISLIKEIIKWWSG
tara:strand:- start:2015 stop:2170 length:156 start_codon:yes stop_codon:yes gene_type:complete